MWTLPNTLTLMRILVIPILVGSFYLGDPVLTSCIAATIFVLAAITDFFDGYLARSTSMVSKLGQFMDPIADKLMVGAVVILLISFQWVSGIHVIAALIILLRELLISGLREFLAEAQVSMPVSATAKWKTTMQMLALTLLLMGPALEIYAIPAHQIGLICLWLAAGLTAITGFDYLRTGIKHIH